MERLTLITPVRITNQHQMDDFITVMDSYYRLFGKDKPFHLISDASPAPFDAQVRGVMNEYANGRWQSVAQGSKPIPALNALVRAVQTEFTHVVLADVRAVGDKNFLAPAMAGMDRDAQLCQVRFADDPLGCGRPYNTSPFESDGLMVFFKGKPDFPFDPLVVDDDVLWLYPMAAAAQEKFIAFAFWPCIYRTSVFKQVVEAAFQRTPPNARTLADWMAVVNRRPDFVNWDLPQKGWPEGFEFLEPLKQATLNMACYEFALGREQKRWDEFLRTSRVELKRVPPAGEIVPQEVAS